MRSACALPQHDHLDLLAEADARLVARLRDAGAPALAELVHLRGPLPGSAKRSW